MVSHVYTQIQAHFPAQISIKVYDITKRFPEKLDFKVLPRKDVWPKAFQLDPPIDKDIGLFFFSYGPERYNCNVEIFVIN